MTSRVIVLSGMSGSGKSHYAQTYFPTAAKCSADNFFWVDGPKGPKSEWVFDPAKLGEAHAFCFREFLAYLTDDANVIVVDNTNCEVWEIAPYVLAARAFGIEAEIITLRANKLEKCAKRNVHGVPLAVITRQWGLIASRRLPGHWNAWEQETA